MIRGLSLFLLLLAATLSAQAELLLQPNDHFVMAGDSITEQRQYSMFIEDYLLMCQPTDGLRIVTASRNEEKAAGFLDRIETDILPFKPTVVSTNYGMNDGLYKPVDEALAQTYRENQTAIIQKLKKAGVRTVLLSSPKCVDTFYFQKDQPGAADTYNKTLENLASIDREIAKSEGVIYVPVFEETLAAMTKSKAALGADYEVMGAEGIHPHANGGLIMAYAFLKAMGCDGAIGTLTVDLAQKQAQVTPGNKVVSFQDTTLTLETTRYPFCFDGIVDEKQEAKYNDINIIKYVPFNQDLNRYMLVVKGLQTPKAKITWGAETNEFAAADLAQGINLASEFLANPFCNQFNSVQDSVRLRQDAEMFLTEQFMHDVDQFKNLDGRGPAAVDRMIANGVDRDYSVHQVDTMKLIIPIQHTIKIEPIPNS